MSNLHFNKSDDLLTFLKILAEESISEAKSSQADSAQKTVTQNIAKDLKAYGITEVEEEEEGKEEISLDIPMVSTPDPSKQQSQEAEAEQGEDTDKSPSEGDSKTEIDVSLDSITDAVKQLRSGKGVGDSQVHAQLRSYFDEVLDEYERTALLAFLRAFAEILTGETDGSSAPDPSAPPYNVSMSSSSKGEKEKSAAPEGEEIEGSEETMRVSASDEEDEEEEEDTSPPSLSVPISPGMPQSMSEIRNRVRKLMNLS